MKQTDRMEYNAACMALPEPGDFWSNALGPVALILAVEGELLTWCYTTQKLPYNKGYTFDLERVVKTHKDMLKQKLTADPAMPCHVSTKKLTTLVELWVNKGSKLYSPIPPSSPSEKVHQLITDWSAKHKIFLMAPQWRDLEARIKELMGA